MRRSSLAALSIAAVLLAACGDGGTEPTDTGGDTTAGATTDGGGAAGDAQVSLIDFEIEAPDSAPAGTTFTVTNDGESVHNWTAEDDTFATDNLQPGQQETVTIDEPGTYSYLCTIHPDIMTGSIEITES